MNNPPVAQDNYYIVKKGASLIVPSFRDSRNWLNNDLDPDADRLNIALVNGQPVGGFREGTIIAGSNGGEFYIDNQGRWSFKDNRDFEDFSIGDIVETSVTYTVADNKGGTATSTP
jgi:hypothetical protein